MFNTYFQGGGGEEGSHVYNNIMCVLCRVMYCVYVQNWMHDIVQHATCSRKIFANFATCSYWWIFFLFVNFFFCAKDCIVDMAIFSALAKIYSSKITTKTAGFAWQTFYPMKIFSYNIIIMVKFTPVKVGPWPPFITGTVAGNLPMKGLVAS